MSAVARPDRPSATPQEPAPLVSAVAKSGLGERDRDRSNPTVYHALLADPLSPVDKEALRTAVRDMQRWTRRYLKPLARGLSLVSVPLITVLKRMLPLPLRWHGAIDFLCLWFMRRFVSNEAAASLIRHFIVETQLINFVLRNAGDPDLPLCELEPHRLGDMGDRTVIRHDLNIYNFLIDLGESQKADVLRARRHAELDFSGLDVPDIDTEPARRRWLHLDIETALYLMNIPFCLFTTAEEYERAVNSFQVDESLCACIANLTGDPVFRSWVPNRFPMWLSTKRDVPRDLYWHAAVNELVHTRLRYMRDAIARGERWPLQASPHV